MFHVYYFQPQVQVAYCRGKKCGVRLIWGKRRSLPLEVAYEKELKTLFCC